MSVENGPRRPVLEIQVHRQWSARCGRRKFSGRWSGEFRPPDPARNSASFNSPPPSQSNRFTLHFSRSQRSAAAEINLLFGHRLLPHPPARGALQFFAGARSVVSMMMGENWFLKISACGIDRAAAADDDAQIIFRQPVLQPPPPEFCPARVQNALRNFNRPRAAHHRVRRGAQFVQMLQVARAAERVDRAVGRGNFSVRRHRHVHQDERQADFELFGLEFKRADLSTQHSN